MSEKLIHISEVSYKQVLKRINFTWHQGETIALMGANGSGKSTLARLLTGLLEPTEGEIILKQGDIKLDWVRTERWKEIGLIGQHPRRQAIGATVTEELSFGLLNQGLPIQNVKYKVQELIRAFGLEGKENQSLNTLSGGERQRLVLAAVLTTEPSFLILDEALTMLDSNAQEKVTAFLSEKSYPMGKLWITHDPELAIGADRLLLIKNGQLYDSGKPSLVLDNPELRREFGIRELRTPHRIQISLGLAVRRRTIEETTEKTGAITSSLKWEEASFGQRLNLDTNISSGEFIGILGPSGAGKSTLLESAIGLITPSKGQILAYGKPVSKHNLATLRKKNRLLLQEAGEYLICNTVYKEVFFEYSQKGNFISLFRNREQSIQSKQDPMIQDIAFLERFSIPAALAFKPPERLSGGERQKVALAATLQTSPEILLLDEPMLGLDVAGREALTRVINELPPELTILYVTHDLLEVLPFANRLWLIQAGKLVLDCQVEEWSTHVEEFRTAGVRC